jgi:hypothetical protein
MVWMDDFPVIHPMWSGMVRVFRCLLVLLVAASFLMVSQADSDRPAQAGLDGPALFDAVFFPWVPNGHQINGTGPWHGSITLQNIDVDHRAKSVRVWLLDGPALRQIALDTDDAGDPYSLNDVISDPTVPHVDLAPNASVTLSAAMLDLPEPGSAVVALALYKDALGPEADFDPIAPVITGMQKQASPQPLTGAATSSAHVSVDGYTAVPLPDIAWGSQSALCHQLRGGVNACDGTGQLGAIDTFDGHSFLPIVQTNSGWNTEIYLSNIDVTDVSAAQVEIILTESDQRGSLAPGEYRATETINIPPGETAVVDARALVGEEWIGSAQIISTVGVASVAMRSKPEDDMLMINISAPSLGAASAIDLPYDPLGPVPKSSGPIYEQYAPLVFQDYNGWNTGFSFVNLSDQGSRVSVTFMTSEGRMIAGDARTISPLGQEFIYIPASDDLNANDGFAGAAIFRADQPFHVAIDQVKYSTGEAMSYLATANGAVTDESLSVPLIQKGWLDGTGDTSGIQVMNVDASESITLDLHFYDSAGTLIGPSRYGPVRTTLGPRQFATWYTMSLSELPQNQRGSVVLTPVDGEGAIVGVSNTVNYAVSGDGSLAVNMVNSSGHYRTFAEVE